MLSMKVLHVCKMQNQGGAGRAAHRIFAAQVAAGMDAWMLVQDKVSEDERVFEARSPGLNPRLRKRLDKLPCKLAGIKPLNECSTAWMLSFIAARINQFEPDIVHLHWVNHGFMSIGDIGRIRKPVVWTCHDLWPLTAMRHYEEPFSRDLQGEYRKPSAGLTCRWNLERLMWRWKRHCWKNLDLTLLGPSEWVRDCARSSSLHHGRTAEILPYSVELDKFTPRDRERAKRKLGIAEGRFVVLFGAVSLKNRRKGYAYLQRALGHLKEGEAALEFVVFGAGGDLEDVNTSTPFRHLGQISSDSQLAEIYSAADVMIMPSEQETWGQTASEALCCGTPVVAFDHSGPKTFVRHQENGYLATPFDSEDLAHGIRWVMQHHDAEALRRSARESMTAFSADNIAERSMEIYSRILGERGCE